MADKDDGERKRRSAEIWSTFLVSSVNETVTTLRNGKRWVSLFKCSPQLGCSSFNSKISFIHLANFQQKAFLSPPKFKQFSCEPGRSACCSLISARWLFIIFSLGRRHVQLNIVVHHNKLNKVRCPEVNAAAARQQQLAATDKTKRVNGAVIPHTWQNLVAAGIKSTRKIHLYFASMMCASPMREGLGGDELSLLPLLCSVESVLLRRMLLLGCEREEDRTPD